MRALYKKELRTFLSSIIGAVVLAVFLLVSGLFHWVFPGQWNLLESGVAEMSAFLPVHAVDLPLPDSSHHHALHRRGTEERHLGTVADPSARCPPHRVGQVPRRNDAGRPRAAAHPRRLWRPPRTRQPTRQHRRRRVLAGYLGLLLLGGAFVATGLFTSARTDSQVVAFLSSALMCMLLYYGPSALGSYALFGSADLAIQWLAMETHFRSIGTGVVVVSDVAWFIAYIALALALAQRHIQPRRS